MSTAEALITIAVVAVLTFLLRFLPFLLFGRKERPSPVLDSLNKLLPSAIIAVLVVYCLKNVSFQQINTFVPELIAVAVLVFPPWKRNNLVSIGGGTVAHALGSIGFNRSRSRSPTVIRPDRLFDLVIIEQVGGRSG